MTYSELTLQYFRAALDAQSAEAAAGVGSLGGPGTLRGVAGSRAQGTWVQFDLQESAGIVRAARFLALACPHTIAVAGWVAEHAVGQALRAALPAPVQELSERFAVPVEKRGRLLIIEDAWTAAAAGALQRRY
jgi:NifU-like protein involved in Fe-S cluster formation